MCSSARILGLDIGTKRIGVAISDPLCIFATELELVERKSNDVDDFALKRIVELCVQNGVKTIVAGVPYTYNENDDRIVGTQAQNCIDFANALAHTYEKTRKTPINIEFVDESLTSFEAEELLKKENIRYTKNKGLVDLKAACLILEEYLRSK